MRTAVVRVDVDPEAGLTSAQSAEAMSALVETASAAGVDVVRAELAGLPAGRRIVELLIAGDDSDELRDRAVALCDDAFGPFGVAPAAGVLTWVSRGTDDDAHGVLAAMGLRGEMERVAGEQGWDVVQVTLSRADLERVPESRVHTALEASLNCEVRIVVI